MNRDWASQQITEVIHRTTAIQTNSNYVNGGAMNPLRDYRNCREELQRWNINESELVEILVFSVASGTPLIINATRQLLHATLYEALLISFRAFLHRHLLCKQG